MTKKSTDFEWEPKNKGDKIVSFLLWIILVVLIIYGALIYKNREELFNLKQVARSNDTGEEIKIKVREKIEDKTPDAEKQTTDVKTSEKGSEDKTEKAAETDGKKDEKPSETDSGESTTKEENENTITVVNDKKIQTRIYVMKAYPFSSKKQARDFYGTLKIKMKDKKVIDYKGIYALVVAGFKNRSTLEAIEKKSQKQGLTFKIFENNNDAIRLDDLKKEFEDRSRASKLEEKKLKDLYTIQVVSVRNAANAEKLKNKVQAESGIKDIFIIPGQRDSRPIYKVRVGLFKTREEAETKAKELKAQFDEIVGFWVKQGIHD